MNFDFVQSGKPGPDVLYMDPGDQIAVSIHDSTAGLVTAITDSTTGESASMTASVANGFAHPLFQPTASTCTEVPYAFHPMYSTSSEHTRVPWAVHSYNVAFSDEIGHFEYCNRTNPLGKCVNHGVNDPKKDGDDTYCFDASASLLVKVTGCLATDYDFDGTSYRPGWSGTLPDVSADQQLHSESFLFTSPLSGGLNYERIAFEADLPAIEFATGCDTVTGEGCVNPPPGANFYPIYSTRGTNGCAWQEGGTFIPGTTNTFGGTSTSEYGSLLALVYANFPGDPGTAPFFEDFRNVLSTNPCPAPDSYRAEDRVGGGGLPSPPTVVISPRCEAGRREVSEGRNPGKVSSRARPRLGDGRTPTKRSKRHCVPKGICPHSSPVLTAGKNARLA